MRESDAEVRDRAESFRAALERIPPSARGVALEAFPRGSCSDASDLLGTYLTERGFGKFERVSGQRRSGSTTGLETHAWLERDGLIVDITADQFPEVGTRVVVARNSDWHRGWTITSRLPADFQIAGSFELIALGRAYETAAAEADSASR